MKLVIVESPTKCKTIGKYLGKDYKVMASVGHIRDLGTSGPGGLGVDVNNGFKPTYVICKDKGPIIKELKSACKKADEVLLATDPDREGEAIAWHLAQVLSLDVDSTKRLEFHEITKHALTKAIDNPRTIDMNLVASQETRRIMDRIIGFKLSYLLQKKIKSRSAGRVQSVTLKFIVDRENDIKNFIPEEYWTISGTFGSEKIKATLDSFNGKSIKVQTEDEANNIINNLPDLFKVASLVTEEKSHEPKPAFTTSTMQQEAFNQFKYSTKKTALLAQRLYEGVEIDGSPVGLITYMRTDSTRLSPEFIASAKSYINDKYGEKYCGHVHTGKSNKNIQDAHEAIRPTDLSLTPEYVKQFLHKDEYNLYALIYSRALASLMAARIEDVTTLKLDGNGYIFKAEATQQKFDGYSKIYGKFESSTKASELPAYQTGDSIAKIEINKEQHFTKAPARYTEAKIVKLMEEKGIGRPSTYSSTISTLSARKYVDIEKGVLSPTEQGGLTVNELVKFFPTFMDPSYTAQMETSLDSIVAGDSSRIDLLENFYSNFISLLDNAESKMEKVQDKQTGEVCPECGAPLVERHGKYGTFIACSSYPTCHYIKKEAKEEPKVAEGKFCPRCGKPLVFRTGKDNKVFLGCSGFPKCRYVESLEEPKKEEVVEENNNEELIECPKCHEGHLVTKKSRFGTFLGCSNYPKCTYTEKIKKSNTKKDKGQE